jgi:uncharacterized protein YjbI with pentapeptide repeats
MNDMLITHHSLISWQPGSTFTEADLLPLREILFSDLTGVNNPDEKNRLLRQKRDALIDYWLVTDVLQLPEMDLAGADLSGVDLSGFGSAELVLLGVPVAYHFPRGGVKINLANARLTGVNMTEFKVTHSDFTYADLRYANLSNANLRYTNLTGVILCGARSIGMVSFHEVCLQEAVLDDVDLYCSMYQVNLHKASVRRGRLYGVCCRTVLSDACLTKGNLSCMVFSLSSLDRADLTGARLVRCCLNDVTMDGLCLRGANLTKCGGVTHISAGNDISMYRHKNIILDGAYKETRITDETGNEVVVKEPVTLDEFNQMNSFALCDNLA